MCPCKQVRSELQRTYSNIKENLMMTSTGFVVMSKMRTNYIHCLSLSRFLKHFHVGINNHKVKRGMTTAQLNLNCCAEIENQRSTNNTLGLKFKQHQRTANSQPSKTLQHHNTLLPTPTPSTNSKLHLPDYHSLPATNLSINHSE